MMRKLHRFRVALAAALSIGVVAATLVPLAALASTDCFSWSGSTRSCDMNVACTRVPVSTTYYCKQICTSYGYQDPGCCYYRDDVYYYANNDNGDCPCATPGNSFEVITALGTGGTDPNKTCYTSGGAVAPCQTSAAGGYCQ